ncbi:fasciclin domain-containing protein [Ruficoccus amylovorans]|uniref:Fasciclin domain-containing protein n=1 Tax=Ruficoccus amylovorans TaxID=1804625 RepID=A0A842H9V4_9BACT|nr:fasciclin domain-containing protein [Ruficoccus amylovorans]MBC2593192.1 fasciclin domain-containing protein [Ruficoccus amylovorans]
MKTKTLLLSLSISSLLALPAAHAGAGCCGSVPPAQASTAPAAATSVVASAKTDAATCPYTGASVQAAKQDCSDGAKKDCSDVAKKDCSGGACDASAKKDCGSMAKADCSKGACDTTAKKDCSGAEVAKKDCGACPGGSKDDVVSSAAAQGNLNTFLAAVQASGLQAELQAEGPYTLFAPSDEAFASLPAGTLEQLLLPANKDQLAAILSYHVIPGKLLMKDIQAGEVQTANGSPLELAFVEGNFTAGGAKVTETDIIASNGVIFVIDTVLLPNVKTAALTE